MHLHTEPFIFNSDFVKYTTALYHLKQKHPESYQQLHEYAATIIMISEAVEEQAKLVQDKELEYNE